MNHTEKIVYQTQGICAESIHFEVQDQQVKNVSFVKGCNGNLQGLSALVEGMDVATVIKRLEGIKCGHRPTSCPDQLAQALKGC